MYRKNRSEESASILNLDSLMDILSCLVGVMLFLVIYTVLELGTTSFEVSIPTPRDRPVGSRRVLVVANDETIRLLDSSQPVSDLLAGVGSVSLEALPDFVRQVNLSPPTDAFFRYQLHFNEEVSVLDPEARDFDVEVSEIPGEAGDSLHHLAGVSSYTTLLQELDPEYVWIEFGVDSASVGVFRRARDLAEELGFATRWSPLALDFPLTFDLAESSGGPAPRTTESKPRR